MLKEQSDRLHAKLEEVRSSWMKMSMLPAYDL
jgi:hypothetical protein